MSPSWLVGTGCLACVALTTALGCNSAEKADADSTYALPPTPTEFATGEQIYNANCEGCHDTSHDGAPRLGFMLAWKDRIDQGKDVLVAHAIEGTNMMPPRGDNPELTDEQIAQVVEYMLYRAELNIPATH